MFLRIIACCTLVFVYFYLTRKLNPSAKNKKKGTKMEKQEFIDQEVAKIQAAEVDAIKASLGSAVDFGLASAPVVVGGITQEQLDAAVQAVKDGDAAKLAEVQAQVDAAVAKLAEVQAADAQALSDAMAKAAAAQADLQAQVDGLIVKEAKDAEINNNLKAGSASIKAALDALNALIEAQNPVQG